MKVVILAGGKGTRISEESLLKPKPMIEIGGTPILVHIMNHYSQYGFNDFIICAGYKQNCIKEYFSHLNIINNDVFFDLNKNSFKILNSNQCNWKITICDTGLESETAERIKKIKKYIGNEDFLLTYGDGLSNININEIIKSHHKSNKIITISTYNFGQSKGIVKLDKNGNVLEFREKSNCDGDLINIGFMVVNPKIFKYINSNNKNLESDVLVKLAKIKQVNSYFHKGFWQCMDTMREKELLEKLWHSPKCPWRIIK